MDYYTPDEVAAVETLYRQGEQGGLLVASSFNIPWKHRDQGRFRTLTLVDEFLAGDVDAITTAITDAVARRDTPHAYLILTRAQEAYLNMFFGLAEADWQALLDDLAASSHFEVLVSNPDALVLEFVKTGE
jgi:hypothetical protein